MINELFRVMKPSIALGFDESQQAFAKHMENELKTTEGNQLIIISLVDECGKETLLGDSFFEHLLKYNSPHVLYVTFDFHEYWCASSLSFHASPHISSAFTVQ